MKVRSEVSDAKLRGGFYTPSELVARCLDRVAALVAGRTGLSLLEPSAGDGAFLRGLAAHPLGAAVAHAVAVEPLAEAAAACRQAAPAADVREASFLAVAADDARRFDLAVGNPPYVRYQFVTPADKAATGALAARLGCTLSGVANLWVPVFLAALAALAPGGAFAFVVPAELTTGVSAGAVRRWLLAEVEALRCDAVVGGAFAGALQEVVILSGRRRAAPVGGPQPLEVAADGVAWTVMVDPTAATWTACWLAPAEAAAYAEALALSVVRPLGEVARFEVAIVTGANEFFSADDATVEACGLAPWARPLLPRIRHAAGLVYAPADHAAAAAAGVKASLLHFAADAPDPLGSAGPAAYLAAGEAAGLPARFKCRIRSPWYRVPHVRAGRFMLSKRAHHGPRLVLNAAGVLTTDTIYRGALRAPGAGPREEQDVVAAFHNALTWLSAEVEGRSFGGGVLELVPGEVARLALPLPVGFGRHLAGFDALLRAGAGDAALLDATDAALIAADVGFDAALVARLRAGHARLQTRRQARG